MHPHPAVIFDIVTFLACLSALIILYKSSRFAIQRGAQLLFTGLLVFIMLCYSFCLIMEWSGVTGRLDTLENLTGALVPMCWAFVFYAFHKSIAEQSLRESEVRFYELFDEAPIGYHELDTGGRITRVNQTELKMLGYTAEEMLGRFVWEFVIEEETSRQAVMDKLSGAIPPGRAFERTIRQKNGNTFAVLIEDRFLHDDTGNIIGIRSTIQNISKRKQVEEALAKEHNLLRTLIDNIPDNIFVKDTESRFVLGNIAIARSMGAATPDELLGKTDFDFYPKELAEQYYADSQKVMQSGKPLVGQEEPAIDAAGNRKWYLTTKVPLRDQDGKIVGLVGISRDITERKQSEYDREQLMETLASKNKELESILYVTSHDLRAPLVNIQGFSHELSLSCEHVHSALANKKLAKNIENKVHTALNKDIPEALGFITNSASRMESLLSGLLRLSRLGSAALRIESLDMNALLADVTSSMEYQIKQAGATVKIESLPPCFGDASQINQVFTNILNNAIKYLDDSRPGMIHIYADKARIGQNVYCAEDNGVGIAPDHKDKIFEIFYRLEPDKKSGEGLGLTIVKHILERHNGKIWVESEPGVGSKFFVSLPSV